MICFPILRLKHTKLIKKFLIRNVIFADAGNPIKFCHIPYRMLFCVCLKENPSINEFLIMLSKTTLPIKFYFMMIMFC